MKLTGWWVVVMKLATDAARSTHKHRFCFYLDHYNSLRLQTIIELNRGKTSSNANFTTELWWRYFRFQQQWENILHATVQKFTGRSRCDIVSWQKHFFRCRIIMIGYMYAWNTYAISHWRRPLCKSGVSLLSPLPACHPLFSPLSFTFRGHTPKFR